MLQQEFLDLIDKLTLLMSTADVVILINQCDKLMANSQIALFSASFIETLKHNPYPYFFKMYLLPFVTWFDHSILKELVKSSKNKEAIDWVDQFDSRIDYNQPVTMHTIPEFSQLILPCPNSKNEFTIVVTKHVKSDKIVLLQDLQSIKKTLMMEWKVTDHTIHLVAMHSKLRYLYWMIPREIQPMIESTLDKNQQALCDIGIIMMPFLPHNYLSEEYDQPNVGSKFEFLNFSTQDTTEVC